MVIGIYTCSTTPKAEAIRVLFYFIFIYFTGWTHFYINAYTALQLVISYLSKILKYLKT